MESITRAVGRTLRLSNVVNDDETFRAWSDGDACDPRDGDHLQMCTQVSRVQFQTTK